MPVCIYVINELEIGCNSLCHSSCIIFVFAGGLGVIGGVGMFNCIICNYVLLMYFTWKRCGGFLIAGYTPEFLREQIARVKSLLKTPDAPVCLFVTINIYICLLDSIYILSFSSAWISCFLKLAVQLEKPTRITLTELCQSWLILLFKTRSRCLSAPSVYTNCDVVFVFLIFMVSFMLLTCLLFQVRRLDLPLTNYTQLVFWLWTWLDIQSMCKNASSMIVSLAVHFEVICLSLR